MAPNPKVAAKAGENLIRTLKQGDNVAGYLEYKPGPGIYSRLERAVQGLPENVRVQELPGLLKRYKDGIPGWELKAVDLDSVVDGRTTVTRDELLAAVRENSPVFTHKNVILGEGGATPSPVAIGGEGQSGYSVQPKWDQHGLGGPDYRERLLTQPLDPFPESNKNWQDDRLRNHFTGNRGGNVVAHLRTDRNDDALRIVELQSDVQNQSQRMADPSSIPFAARDFWQELQLKSALLDAARGGYRAVEVAYPEDISRAVGFPLEKSEKFYGNMIPQLLERQGKKLGGWESTSRPRNDAIYDEALAQSTPEQSTPDYSGLNSRENQEKAAALEDRILGIAGTDDIHIAEEMLQANPSILDTSSLPVEAKQEIRQYLAYAEHRGTIWDNTGAEDFYSAREALQDPNWRQQHGFSPLDAARVGRLRGQLGLEGGAGFDPNMRGEMGSAEVALRNLDDSSEEILNSIQRRIMKEVDGTDRTVWEATAPNSKAPLAASQRQKDVSDRLWGIAHTLQNTAAARLRNPQEIAPRSIVAERASGKELYDRLEPLIGRERAGQLIPQIMGDIEQYGQMRQSMERLQALQDKVAATQKEATSSGWRGVISDEMRKNIITKGIPAAITLGTATGIAPGSNREANAAPRLPLSDDVLRAAMPWQTQRKIARLTKQVDAAYESGDFKTAEKLDAQREQLVEDWDNKFEQMDDGDGNVDFEDDDPQGSVDDDMEPNDYEGAAKNYEEQIRDIYGSYVAGGPHFETEAELAAALRGVGPDTEKASHASDADLIQEAKAAFDQRQAHLAKVRSRSPEDGVRDMQASLRDMPAGLMAAPIMGQAQSVNESRQLPTGSGGTTADLVRPVLGDFDFSMAISPAEWEAHQQRQQAGDVSPDHQQFRQNVADVMNQPIIRVGAANDGSLAGDGQRGLFAGDGDGNARITPAQFVGEYLDVFAPRLPEEGRAKVMGEVVARLEGSTGQVSQVAEQAIGRMMASLKASAPGGKYAKAEPISEQQLAEWRQQYGDQADWMLSPGSAEDFQAQAGYELLRTMQDGEHAPSYANSMSVATNFLSGGGAAGADELLGGDAISTRAKRANQFWSAATSQPADRPPAFRDADGKPLYSDWDARTLTGLMKAGGDTSSWQGQMTMPMYRFASEWNRNPIGMVGQLDSDSEWAKATGGKPWSLSAHYQALMKPWNTTQDRDQHIERTQQVIKDGMTPEEFRQHIALNRADAEKRESYESSFYPQFQGAWDRVTGDKTPRTWGTPAFEMLAQFPRKSVDSPIAVAASVPFAGANIARGLGAAATSKSLIGALKEAGKGLGKGAASAAKVQFGDIPSDLVTDQGVTAGILGSDYWRAMTTPYADNAFMGDVQPDDPNLDQKREEAEQQRQDEWFSGMTDWNMTPQEREYSRWRKSQGQ